MRTWGFVLGAVVLIAAVDDDARLSLSDLVPYRAALEKPAAGTATRVTFRALWDDPEAYRGKRVRIEGKVARRFTQGAFGTFPALVELWAVSPSGDPFCLVFPASKASDAIPGAAIAFEGTYLKRLRYRGADADRLAPLIVGDHAPTVTSPAPPRVLGEGTIPGEPTGRVEWLFGLVAAGLVALVLARRCLAGTVRRPARAEREREPPLEFVDGG